jgi:flap endonuclease-1
LNKKIDRFKVKIIKFNNNRKERKMGVQHLNSLICSQCETAVEKKHLSAFRGWRVAVDTSIFMYRYKEQGVLLENMFNLVNLLKKYEIIPCFVFDGKPPEEKNAVIKARREERETAEAEFNKLVVTVDDKDKTEQQKAEVVAKLEVLKQKMTRITMEDIYYVRDLLDGMGIMWVEAKGEADVLCARLCIKKHVDACISDDMDMFVYGCPIVWRHISLLQETVFSYNLDNICKCLEVSKNELREVCVLSGTDYSHGTEKKTNLHLSLKLLRRYKKNEKNDKKFDFYEWLDHNTNYVENMYSLYSHLSMFDTKYIYLDKKIFGKKGSMNYKKNNNHKMETALMRENFFFPIE